VSTVIHVVTVHFGTERWIDVQLSYLRRNIQEPYKVWANLHDVPGDHSTKFDRTVSARGEHEGKLNLMAAEICAESPPDDIIFFLDGDAFPVANPLPTVRKGLEETSLVAIRRDENAGDPQPHPSFCAVTAGEWQRIGGDWSMGYCWAGGDGELITDVGGNLLRALERCRAQWTPILRTNKVNVHPVWFGVYGDVVYHHGSGFRKAMSRTDLLERPKVSKRGRRLPVVGRPLRRLNRRTLLRWEARTDAIAKQMSEDMFEKLESNPEFYKDLI
jgi:hypothetical protein